MIKLSYFSYIIIKNKLNIFISNLANNFQIRNEYIEFIFNYNIGKIAELFQILNHKI